MLPYMQIYDSQYDSYVFVDFISVLHGDQSLAETEDPVFVS